MTRTSGRIVISNSAGELLNLAAKVYAKHQADGAASPLTNLDGIQWNVVGPTIETALSKHQQAESSKSQMELAYRERDRYTPQILEAVKASRNLLKALNPKNPKRLSEWGFQVDDSAQGIKTVKTV